MANALDKLTFLNKIKILYNNGGNIIQYLKEIDDRNSNDLLDIMISYDFQAGAYTNSFFACPKPQWEFSGYLAQIIKQLGQVDSILEAGVGEATTLGTLIQALDNNKKMQYYGFDVSWSRIKYARQFVEKLGIYNVHLFMGDLFCSPLKDNSIDIVYTAHSIEPNGGKEKEALEELYWITNKYLVLLEPAYEFASQEAKARMRKHGYVTNLYATAKQLDYNIIEHRLFGKSANPLNPTGLIIIEKTSGVSTQSNPICCPITKTELTFNSDSGFTPKGLLMYPIIQDIPCLIPACAIIATKYVD